MLGHSRAMRTRTALLLALAAVGCAPASRPAPPAPAPVAPPPPAPRPAAVAADWRDWPVTPGAWSYRADARGTVAMYGTAGADAVAVLRCDRAGARLFLSVAGERAGPMTIRTSSVARTLAAGATGGVPPYTAATFAPADALLDAMAFSRGRFALSLPGGPPVVLPAWAEVGRVVEDCRG